jgi:hypothetical protein
MFFLEPNQTRKEALIQSGRFWCDQVLRGGMSQVNQAFQANSSNLCAFVMLGTQNRPENKAVKVVLAKPSTSLVVMLCRDQPSSNEEVFLHTLQLSVRETPGFVRPCFTTPTPRHSVSGRQRNRQRQSMIDSLYHHKPPIRLQQQAMAPPLQMAVPHCHHHRLVLNQPLLQNLLYQLQRLLVGRLVALWWCC